MMVWEKNNNVVIHQMLHLLKKYYYWEVGRLVLWLFLVKKIKMHRVTKVSQF